MKYGIDLDGVCYDFVSSFGRWLEGRLGVDYVYEDIVDYLWYKCIDGLDEKNFWEEFHKFGGADMYRWLPLIDGTREAIQALRSHGDDLVFVTARPEYTEKTTRFVIARDFGVTDKLYFSSGKDYKSDAVKSLNIDVFVEDSPDNAVSIANKTNAKVYLRDTPYNRDVEDHPRIIRFKSWNELLDMENINVAS